MRKSKPKPIKEFAQPGGTGMHEAADFLMSIPEIAEAWTRADIELAIDDRGWERLTGTKTPLDLDYQSRFITVNKCRLYWQKDPLAKQAVRLWTDYAVGKGVTYSTDDVAAQTALDDFMKNRRNKKLLSSAGQQRNSKKLLIDGELFFAIFTGDSGEKIVRLLDPNQITDLITDPDDEDRVLAYRRLTAKDKVLYYQDWALDEEGVKLAEQQKDPTTRGPITLQKDVVVYHLPFDNLGNRGNGLLSSVVDWSREHRRFMEARVAITQALAKFAYKMTTKGGQAVLSSLRSRIESTVAQTGTQGGAERQPTPAPGSTWLQNAGVDMTPMPRVTGAAEARDDSDGLKLMVSAGTNIMLHYFGDPSTGNLATATAMELPMLKSFEGYQQFWIDAWRDIFAIVLEEDLDTEATVIDITLPSILEEDLQPLGTYLTQVFAAFPEAKVPEVLQLLLTSMGCNNISELMEKIAENKKVVDAQAQADKQLMAKQPKATPAVESDREIAAVEGLSAALRSLAVQPAQSAVNLPIDLNITLSEKNRKRTGKAIREKNGDITMTMEEVEHGA